MVASSHLVDLQIVPQFHLEDSITAHWATVGLCELASANVVGYQTKALRSGFTATGASFVNVTNGTIKLGDIKISGYGDDGYGDNMIIVQTLTSNGKTKDKYYWADYTEGEVTWYGWYNAEWDICYNEVPLAPGDGLWIQSPSTNISIQNAGAVSNESLPVNLTAGGFKLIANPMPTSINLGLITVSGYGNEYCDNMIIAQTLTENGKADAKYYWVDYSEEEVTWYGWYNTEWNVDYNSVPLAAGVGLWIQAPDGNALTITFPSPIAE